MVFRTCHRNHTASSLAVAEAAMAIYDREKNPLPIRNESVIAPRLIDATLV